MRVIVKPLGYLRKYLKDYLNEGENQVELYIEGDSVSVRELLVKYGFDMNRVGFVMCNDNIASLEYMLKNGDRLVVMTMPAGG